MQFDAILFDLDHTLFDSASSELEALDKTFRSNGITPLQGIFDLYKSINIDLWTALENEQITLERLRVKRFEDLVSQLDLHADPHALAELVLLELKENYQDEITSLKNQKDQLENIVQAREAFDSGYPEIKNTVNRYRPQRTRDKDGNPIKVKPRATSTIFKIYLD